MSNFGNLDKVIKELDALDEIKDPNAKIEVLRMAIRELIKDHGEFRLHMTHKRP